MDGQLERERELANLRCAECLCTSARGSPDRRRAMVSGRRHRGRHRLPQKTRPRLHKREPACWMGSLDRKIRARIRGGRTRSPGRRRQTRKKNRGRRRKAASPPFGCCYSTRFQESEPNKPKVAIDRKNTRRSGGPIAHGPIRGQGPSVFVVIGHFVIRSKSPKTPWS